MSTADVYSLMSALLSTQKEASSLLQFSVNHETLKTLLGDDYDIVELPDPGVLKISERKSPKKKTAQLTVPTDFSPPKVSIRELEQEDPLTHVNPLPQDNPLPHDPLLQDNLLPHDPLLQDNPLPHDPLLRDDALPQDNMLPRDNALPQSNGLPQNNEGSQGNTLLGDSALSHDLVLDEDIERSGYDAGGQTSGSGNRRGKVCGGKCRGARGSARGRVARVGARGGNHNSGPPAVSLKRTAASNDHGGEEPPMKKPRGKLVVPPRAPSSRYVLCSGQKVCPGIHVKPLGFVMKTIQILVLMSHHVRPRKYVKLLRFNRIELLSD